MLSMKRNSIFLDADNFSSKAESPSSSHREPFFPSKEEEYRQIRQCRYIRKTRRQQSDVEKFDFTSLFDNLPPVENEATVHAKKINEDGDKEQDRGNEKEHVAEEECGKSNSVDESQEHTKEEVINAVEESSKPQTEIFLPKKRLQRVVMSPIQPVIVHEGQILSLKRDKMEPLVLKGQDNNSSNKLDIDRHSCTMDNLYKEISLAAKNAHVDLSIERRSLIKDKKKAKAMEARAKSERVKKRWAFLRFAVKSGWLSTKKGRALKMMRDRQKKRLQNQINEITPATMRRAAIKMNEQPIETSYIRRKLGNSKSLPPIGDMNKVRHPLLDRNTQSPSFDSIAGSPKLTRRNWAPMSPKTIARGNKSPSIGVSPLLKTASVALGSPPLSRSYRSSRGQWTSSSSKF